MYQVLSQLRDLPAASQSKNEALISFEILNCPWHIWAPTCFAGMRDFLLIDSCSTFYTEDERTECLQ